MKGQRRLLIQSRGSFLPLPRLSAFSVLPILYRFAPGAARRNSEGTEGPKRTTSTAASRAHYSSATSTLASLSTQNIPCSSPHSSCRCFNRTCGYSMHPHRILGRPRHSRWGLPPGVPTVNSFPLTFTFRPSGLRGHSSEGVEESWTIPPDYFWGIGHLSAFSICHTNKFHKTSTATE